MQTVASSGFLQKNVQTKAVDESMLDDRLEAFLSLFEEHVADEDIDEVSVRDRILALKLHQKAFEPLLLHLKETRPSFCRLLQQHPLLTGKT